MISVVISRIIVFEEYVVSMSRREVVDQTQTRLVMNTPLDVRDDANSTNCGVDT